jgi:hypothetical protein
MDPSQSRSAPVVLWILALQLLFEFWIGFTPENRQVFSNLHRAVTRREHLNTDGNAATGDPDRFFDAVQILDARRNRRRPVDGIDDLYGVAVGQLNPLRCIIFYPRLLLPREP